MAPLLNRHLTLALDYRSAYLRLVDSRNQGLLSVEPDLACMHAEDAVGRRAREDEGIALHSCLQVIQAINLQQQQWQPSHLHPL